MRTSSIVIASIITAFAVPAAFGKDAPTKTQAPTVKANKKSLATCTSFDQTDKDDDTVTFSIKSSCEIPIDCTVQWRLVCAPTSKSRRAEHAKLVTFTAMGQSSSQSTDAGGGECGADSWEIDQVSWSCTPNKD